MILRHDYSHISEADNEFINRGYAHIELYGFRFCFIYSSGQRLSDSCLMDKQRSGYMRRVLDCIANKHPCYQYNVDGDIAYSSNQYDLFFWCNSVSGERDYSYYTLTFNSHHSTEQRLGIYKSISNILDAFTEDSNLEVDVQYETQFLDDKIEEAAKAIAPNMCGKPCFYHGASGKIVSHNEGFYFKKKYAKKYGYELSVRELLRLSWSMPMQY